MVTHSSLVRTIIKGKERNGVNLKLVKRKKAYLTRHNTNLFSLYLLGPRQIFSSIFAKDDQIW